jgi:hypothetical protein
MHSDLLWYRDRGSAFESLERRPASWRAPTWSWASVVGPVRWSDSKFLPTMKMNVSAKFRAAMQPAGPDPYGEIESGILWITAPSVELKVIPEKRKAVRSGTILLRAHGLKSIDRLDGRAPDKLSADLDFPAEWGDATSFRLVLLSQCPRYTSKLASSVSGILLFCVDDEKQVYERVGMFTDNLEGHLEDWLQRRIIDEAKEFMVV